MASERGERACKQLTLRGADLMFPGVVEVDVIDGDGACRTVPIASADVPRFLKGEKWQVTLHPCTACSDEEHAGAVAVGAISRNWAEVERRGDGVPSGKALDVIQSYKDYLWSRGSKTHPPIASKIKRDSGRDTGDGESEEDGDAAAEDAVDEGADGETGEEGEDASVSATGDDAAAPSAGAAGRGDGEEDAEGDKEEEEEEQEEEGKSHGGGGGAAEAEMSVEEMDRMMRLCFLQALKTKVCDTVDGRKPRAGSELEVAREKLPLKGSAFYSSCMKTCRPCDLDMKRTSYRKLAKFLHAMQDEGFVQVKEFRRGEPSIISVAVDHPALVEFEPYRVRRALVAAVDREAAADAPEAAVVEEQAHDKPVKVNVTELLRAPARMHDLFTAMGCTKDQLFTAKEALEVLWRYVAENELQVPDDGARVRLDPMLAKALYSNPKGAPETLLKKEAATSLPAKMKQHYAVSVDGGEEVIHKGAPLPIRLTLQSRGGKKFVTSVHGAERFGIDPTALSRMLRTKFAASSTVTSVFVSNAIGEEQVVQIGGDRVRDITKFLKDQFGLSPKYVDVEAKVKPTKPNKKGRR